jgi:adenosine deaminase
VLINLHTHLEGWLRPATASEFARASGMPEPAGGWRAALQLSAPADLTVFLAKVAAGYQFFDTVDHVQRIACEAVEDAAADGCDYLELRFGPATHARRKLDIDTVVRAVCAGAAEGRRRTGMPVGCVVAALRHHDDDTILATAHAASANAGAGVVGFDLAGDERLYPDLARYRAAFELARAAGLGLTCHAAEAAPGAAAREAVALLGVRRIGHGTRLADHPDDLAWAAGEGIVVEMCPTSNVFTGATASLGAHPARTFLAAGVPLVLGDDDPTTVGTTLSREHRILRDRLGFNHADLDGLDATSVRTALITETDRAHLTARLMAQTSAPASDVPDRGRRFDADPR